MSSQVSQNGTAYDLLGESGNPVVVLIHGMGLCRKMWEYYLPALSERYQVLSYDLYGHGESGCAPQKASLSVYAEQLFDLLAELEIESAAIVGFSIGGMINRRFALDYPNKVSALLILNSPHDRGKHAQEAVEQRALKAADEGSSATLEEALKRWFTSEFYDSGSQVLEEVRKWRTSVDDNSYAQTAWVLANGVVELTRSTLAVTVPTLVLTCENDVGSTPAMSRAIQAQIQGAELEIVPRLRHLGLMEQPELFESKLRNFLRRSLQA